MPIGSRPMRQSSPTVSVVIPVFNGEYYIAEAIQSVLDQSFTDFELLVVNDGSTDGTEDVVLTFHDPRITYVKQDNQGVSAARNMGIAHSTGSFVALLDSDDFWYPNRLQRQLEHVHDDGPCVVFSWVDAVDDDSRVVEPSEVSSWFNRTSSSSAEMMYTFFTIGNCLCASTALIDRKHLDEVGGFCLTAIQAQDFDLWIKLVKKTNIAILPEKLAAYRVRGKMSNLTYDPTNIPRIRFEYQQIYRTMFDQMPSRMLHEAFPARTWQAHEASVENLELEKAFLYLDNTEPHIQYIGMERLYYLLQDQATADIARKVYGFTLPDFFAITRATPAEADTLSALKAQLAEREEAIRWHDEQRQNWQRIAEDRATEIAELKAWLAEREEAIRWHDEQRQNWQRIAEDRAREA